MARQEPASLGAPGITTEIRGVERLFRDGLFGMAYVAAKEVRVSPPALAFTAIVEVLQMLSFPLNYSAHLPWISYDGSFVSGFSRALSYLSTDSADETHGTSAYLVLLVSALTWSAGFVCLALLVAWRFANRQPQVAASLRALRAVAWLSTTILFLPFSSVLLRAFACPSGDHWVGTDVACFTGLHLATIAAVSLILPTFTLLTLFSASIFISRAIRLDSTDSKLHGRADAIMILVKVALGIPYNCATSALGGWFLTTLLVLSGLLWLSLYLLRRPYVNPSVNCALTAGASIYVAASLCLAAEQLHGDRSGDPSAFLFLTCATAGTLGWTASKVLHDRIQSRPLAHLRRPRDVHSWVMNHLLRAQETDRMDDDALKEALGAGDQESSWIGASGSGPARPDGQVLPTPLGVTMRGPDGDVRRGFGASLARLHGTRAAGDADEVRSVVTRGHAQHGVHTMSSTALKRALQLLLIRRAERGVRRMLQLYGNDARTQLLAAQFYRDHRTSRFLEMCALARAARSSSALDTQFFVWQRYNQLREENFVPAQGHGGAGDSGRGTSAWESVSRSSSERGLSPIERVMFDQQLAEVRSLYRTIYRNMLALWDALGAPVPDLYAVEKAGTELQSVSERAQSLYGSLLSLNPESTVVLRTYGDFLMAVVGNRNAAQEFFNRADRLEAVHTKQHAAVLSHVVVGRPAEGNEADALHNSAAVLTVSGDLSCLGEIISVSTGVRELTGMSKLQLVGQHISSLIAPVQLGKSLDWWIREFVDTGESPYISRPILLFCRLRAGSMRPVWFTMREAPPAKNSMTPRFVVEMVGVRTRRNHVFLSEVEDFRVLSADAATVAEVGLDADTDANDEAHRWPTGRMWFPALSRHYARSVVLPAGAQMAPSPSRHISMQYGHSSVSSSPKAGDMVGADCVASAGHDGLTESRPSTITVRLSSLVTAEPESDQLTLLHTPAGARFALARLQSVELPGMDGIVLLSWIRLTAAQAMQLALIQRKKRASGTGGGRAGSVEAGHGEEEEEEDDDDSLAMRLPEQEMEIISSMRDLSHALEVGEEDLPRSAKAPVFPSLDQPPSALRTAAHKVERSVSFAIKDAEGATNPGVHGDDGIEGSDDGVDDGALVDGKEAAGEDQASEDGSVTVHVGLALRDLGTGDEGAQGAECGSCEDEGEGEGNWVEERKGRTPGHRGGGGGGGGRDGGRGVQSLDDPRSHAHRSASTRSRSRSHTAGKDEDGHSQSSSTTMSVSNAAFRRSLLERRFRNDTVREAKLLNRAVLAVFVAVVSVTVGMHLVWDDGLEELRTMQNALRSSGVRLSTVQRLFASFRFLYLSANDVNVYGDLDSFRASMEDTIKEFEDAHLRTVELNKVIDRTGYALERERTVPFKRTTQTGGGITEMLTAVEAGQRAGAMAREAIRLPKEDLKLEFGHPYVYTFKNNFDALQSKLNTTMHAELHDLFEELDALQLRLIVYFAATFAAIVLLASTFFVSIVRQLRNRTEEVLRTFLFVPRAALRVLREQASYRYEATLLDEATAEAAAGRAGGGGEQSLCSPGLRGSAGGPSSSKSGPAFEDDVVDWHAVLQTRAGQQRKHAFFSLRSTRNSSPFLRVTVARLLLPLILIAGWATAVVLFTNTKFTRIEEASTRTLMAQLENTMMTSATASLMQAVADTIPSMEERLFRVDLTEDRSRQVAELNHLLLFGGAAPKLHPVYGKSLELSPLTDNSDSVMYNVLANDVCDGLLEANRTRCALVRGGLLSEGLFSAMTAWANDLRMMLDSLPVNFPLNVSIVTPTVRSTYFLLFSMERPYLQEAFTFAADHFDNEIASLLNELDDFLRIVGVLLCMSFFLSVLFIYMPTVRALNRRLHQIRMLLILVPDALVDKVPEIQGAVRRIALEEGQGSPHKKARKDHKGGQSAPARRRRCPCWPRQAAAS